MCSSRKYGNRPFSRLLYRRKEKVRGTGCYLFYQFSLVYFYWASVLDADTKWSVVWDIGDDFRVSQSTFDYIVREIQDEIVRKDTPMRKASRLMRKVGSARLIVYTAHLIRAGLDFQDRVPILSVLGLPLDMIRALVKFWSSTDGAKSFSRQNPSVPNQFLWYAYFFLPCKWGFSLFNHTGILMLSDERYRG